MATSNPGTQKPQPPTLLQVVGSTLAALCGIQSQKNRERDFTQGNAKVFIVVGAILTAFFVLTLAGTARLVMWFAGV